MTEKITDALALRSQPQAMSPQFRFVPTSWGEAMEMATFISKSNFAIKDYKNNPSNCLIAYEFGSALGLSWLQAMRNIAVINGMPSIWGDAIPALILGSGECEQFDETFVGEFPKDEFKAVCVVKRKGMNAVTREFSIGDAKKADLWSKSGTWATYPKRMLQMRARGFAARDGFADKLSGLIVAEEAMDYPTTNVTAEGEVVESTPLPLVELEKASQEHRDAIAKAFEALHMTAGQQIVKLTEYFKDGAAPDEAATAFLAWARDEYSKRRTGTPAPRKDDNSNAARTKAPPPVPETTTETAAPATAAPADAAPATAPKDPQKESPVTFAGGHRQTRTGPSKVAPPQSGHDLNNAPSKDELF